MILPLYIDKNTDEIEILCGKMEGGVRSPRLKLQRFL